MGVLGRLLIAFLLTAPWQAFAWTLTCDNGTNHRYYDIVGSPWGRVRVESSGSRKGVGYLSISANLMPKGNRCLKIRAVGDNDTLVSPWVQWCYTRESFDGNFTGDENTTDVPVSSQHYNADAGNWDVIEGGHSVGLQLGAH